MGIVRYPVECPGCSLGIVLRLAVGHEQDQPFFYVCPKCSAATKGSLRWDGGAKTTLTLQSGRQLDSEDGCNDAVNINPEFPSVPFAKGMEEPGGSAFIYFFQMLGPEVVAFQRSSAMVHAMLTKDWNTLSRLTTYYRNRDWAHFDKGLKDVWPKEAPAPTKDWHRDDALHRLYEFLLMPLLGLDPNKYYIDMKFEWSDQWESTEANYATVVNFAKAEASNQLYLSTQRDVFACIERYLMLVSAILPGLVCNMLPAAQQPTVDTLRVFRDEYVSLRDLYINSFEVCHKALRWIIGVVNARTNGDPNKFVLPASIAPSKVQPPKNLNAFFQLTSAEKRKWLVLLPVWDASWDDLFDRHLRNDIGHASARHDLPTGAIERDGKPALPYVRFVQKVQRSLHALLACANALKYIRIYSVV